MQDLTPVAVRPFEPDTRVSARHRRQSRSLHRRRGCAERHSCLLGSFPSRRASATHAVCAWRRCDLSPSGNRSTCTDADGRNSPHSGSGRSWRPGSAPAGAPTTAAPSSGEAAQRRSARAASVAEAREIDEPRRVEVGEVHEREPPHHPLEGARVEVSSRAIRSASRSQRRETAEPNGRPTSCRSVPNNNTNGTTRGSDGR